MDARFESVLHAHQLPERITGIPDFRLSDLSLPDYLPKDLPRNLRLGHLVEKVVSQFLKAASNYSVLQENIQIEAEGRTIGELDYILQNNLTQQIVHLELAYKFYLYDPTISDNSIENWIGPNRNDSLIKKLRKLKDKQFPLLYREATKELLHSCAIESIVQKLCFLVSLFIPYEKSIELDVEMKERVVGYYIYAHQINDFITSDSLIYIPTRTDWGIDPTSNKEWYSIAEREQEIQEALEQKQSLLCWKKTADSYSLFIIVWWDRL